MSVVRRPWSVVAIGKIEAAGANERYGSETTEHTKGTKKNKRKPL
jgi:hypothetical protein